MSDTSSIADVLIVGAGASGGVAARRLQAAGLSVIALEQGDWHDRADFRGSEWDWELAASRQWSPDPHVRAAAADYPLDLADSDISVLNFNGVGGGTILYNAIWPRFLPANFRTRSRCGIADDWPIDYAELLPFYEATDREIGVSGLGGDPAYPPSGDYPLPPHPLSTGHLAVARALHARGWHWWPGPNAILSAPYQGRHACVRRGTCTTGCNEGAKASVDRTHWREFVAKGGTLVTGARVARITTDGDGRASGAIWRAADCTEHFQPARLVLLAANAVGTARLLLASASDRFPNGLCNSSDLVGRRLMMHPLAVVTGFFGDALQSWQGLNGASLISLQFAADDPAKGFRGGAKWSLQPMGGGPAMESFKLLARQTSPESYHSAFERRFGHNLMWSILCEDMPDPENRVTLSENVVDGSGIAAPKISYRISDDARACLDYNCEQAADVFRAAGAWATEANNPAPYNAHFMGTARMGDDPSSSVVDRWGLSHDVPNLGIIDGSVFVTSATVNPTTTICALAARTADRIVDRLATLPVARHAAPQVFDLKPASERMSADPAEPPPRATWAGQILKWGDELIPSVDDLPGAGTLLVRDGLLDRVFSGRPDLEGALVRAVEIGGNGPVHALAGTDLGAWMAVLSAVSAGYCLDPRVRRRIGYEGQVPDPVRPDNYPDYVAEGLLDHMLDGRWQAEFGEPV